MTGGVRADNMFVFFFVECLVAWLVDIMIDLRVGIDNKPRRAGLCPGSQVAGRGNLRHGGRFR